MAAELTIRPFEEGDEPAIRAALDRAIATGKDTIVSRTAALWDWRYRANPAGSRIALTLGEDGAVVHHQGGVPLRMIMNGEPAVWTRWTDTLLDRDATDHEEEELYLGAARAFHREFGGPAPEKDPVFFGTPAQRIHQLGERALGHEVVRDLNLLTLDAERFEGVTSEGGELEELQDFASSVGDLAELFARASEGRGALAIRDAEFLRWRFDAHPEHEYRIACTRGGAGQLTGYAVYRRVETERGVTGLICDWLTAPGDVAAASALRRWSAVRATEDGAGSVRALFADTCPEWLEFQVSGFRVRPAPFFAVAHSFQRPYTAPWLHTHWYYTLADFDHEAGML